MSRYYIRDERQKSLHGKPEGAWLKEPPATAIWVKRREQARSFTVEEVESLKKAWPYLEGCDLIVVPVEGGSE